MLMVVSPAKSLDFSSTQVTDKYSQPDFLDHSELLVEQLRELSPPDIQQMMKISADLANLNFGRFLNWQQPFTPDNARQALLAFTGDVYQGMEAQSFTDADFAFAQDHLRILSGLYGLLRPLDLIQPYRLEMGTAFANNRGKNLYQFWGDVITDAVQQTLHNDDNVLVNLASNEYFKAINRKKLDARVITPVFRDLKNGRYKVISFYAKKARGMMAAFMIKNRITDPEKLKDFDGGGYYFCQAESSDKEWVFLRDSAE